MIADETDTNYMEIDYVINTLVSVMALHTMYIHVHVNSIAFMTF